MIFSLPSFSRFHALAQAIAGIGLALWLGACAREPLPPPAPTAPIAGSSDPISAGAPSAAAFANLPGWNADRQSEALPALLKSCAVFLKKPANAAIGPGGIGGQAGDWRGPCDEAARLVADSAGDEAARHFFETHFRLVLSPAMIGQDGFFTGYYEAEFSASRRLGPIYRYPLYLAPPSPVNFTRAEIEAGALAGRGLEFVFLADPVDRFFLQVQGSGRLRLAEGGVLRVGYGGNNGHGFVPVGKKLLEAGRIDRGQANAQGVAAWLKSHPGEAQSWMNLNPRYIFFREIRGAGPIGAMGIPLTATRSLAIDPDFVPLGIPVWLDTLWPIDNPTARQGDKLRRLMLAQDTGAAIKGAMRGDFFWGTGASALAFAGHMKSPGRWVLLLPASVVARHPDRLRPYSAPGS